MKKPGPKGPHDAKVRERRRQLLRVKFVRAYVGGAGGVAGNAKAAALAAGLATTGNSAGVRGHLMLRDPVVVEMIERRTLAIGGTKERFLEELGRVAFLTANQIHEVEQAFLKGRVEELDDATQSVVSGVEVTHDQLGIVRVKVHTQDKLAAMALLAKMNGWVGLRVEVTGRNGGPIENVLFVLPAPTRRVVDVTSKRLETP